MHAQSVALRRVLSILLLLLLALALASCAKTDASSQILTLYLGKDVVFVPLPAGYKGTTVLPPRYAALTDKENGPGVKTIAIFFSDEDMKLFQRDIFPDGNIFHQINMLETFIPDRIYHSSFLELVDSIKSTRINQDITSQLANLEDIIDDYLTENNGMKTSVRLESVTTTDILYENKNAITYGMKFDKSFDQAGIKTKVTSYSLFSVIWVDGKIMNISSHTQAQEPDALNKLKDATVSFINGILAANKKVERVVTSG